MSVLQRAKHHAKRRMAERSKIGLHWRCRTLYGSRHKSKEWRLYHGNLPVEADLPRAEWWQVLDKLPALMDAENPLPA